MRRVPAGFRPGIARAGIAIVAAHLTLSAVLFIDAPVLERLVLAIFTISCATGLILKYDSLPPSLQALACFVIGLAASIGGLTLHAIRIGVIGFSASDVTGIAMLVAGVTLTVIGIAGVVRLAGSWWTRLLLLPIGLVVFFFVLFPVSLGVYATNVAVEPCCDETPADRGLAYEDVRFETPGGLELAAWYIPGSNGATVIVVHGSGDNRSDVLGQSAVLAKHGYGVFMLDIEGFGNSEGRANAFGWVGARDVHAAIDYLKARPGVDPQRIGGLGLSMGGEIMLQAAGESDALRAVVAEGATGRTAADFAEASEGWFKPVVPFHTVVGLTMRLISGESTPPPLKEMVRQIPPRPVLLIAADIGDERKLMGFYRDLGGPSFELWTIPESTHTGAYKLHPEEYEQRVIEFFDAALLGSLRSIQ